jgi:hypothetical protein
LKCDADACGASAGDEGPDRYAPVLRAKLAEHVTIRTAFVDLETKVISASVPSLNSKEATLVGGEWFTISEARDRLSRS